MPLDLVAISIALLAVSGLPGLLPPRRPAGGQLAATALVCLGSLSGLAGLVLQAIAPDAASYVFPWQAAGGSFVGLDALSAFFLVPILLVGALGSVYGLGYWPQAREPRTAGKLQVFWGLLMAGMSLLVIARHALAFLMGWEIMALSAFFLVSTEDGRAECCRSGLVYIVATHIGTLTLFGLFVLWRAVSGSFALEPLRQAPPALAANALFFLAFIGFGLKAGMMPLHFWLPGAHANAPSHVSAMLSGVLLKMGVYGLVRMLSLLPDPPAVWGGLVLFAGAASAVLGVAFALAQHDLKRLLAYHSVENIGIILMGLGLAMLGRSLGRPEWIILGMGGCLLHVWNHSLFKPLLFMGAGSVLKATGTRRMDRLGGLAARMPWTAALFLAGAAAICGLPPLNGFVSEFLIYLGFFKTLALPGAAGSLTILAAPALAMVGALAMACFVKAYGTTFLGLGRTEAPRRALESPPTMIAPMAVLASLCILIGLAPGLVAPVLDGAIAAWVPVVPGLAIASLAPLSSLSQATLGLLAAIAILAIMQRRRQAARKTAGSWDCGYASPGPRMQYSATSFAKTLVGLFSWVLRPQTHQSRIAGPFPGPSELASHVDELVLDRALIPGFQALRRRFHWFRRFQQGQTHFYVLYIIVVLLALLATLIPFKDMLTGLFAL